MLNSLFIFIAALVYPNGSTVEQQSILGLVLSISILISLLMLPINIRLAGQLIMQLFKYRYIVQHKAMTDVDIQVMTGYYDHFKAVMAIIVSILGFNVFNVISSVYFIAYFIRSEWEYSNYWFACLSGGMYIAFQEGVILFAVTMFYQFTCFFQERKFRFKIILILASIRSIFIISHVIFNTSFLTHGLNPIINIQTPGSTFVVRGVVFYVLLAYFSVVFIISEILRFPLVFSFIRAAQRIVKKHIKNFKKDLYTQFLGRNHYVDKIRAYKLFQIAGWGTIIITFLSTFSIAFEFVLSYVVLFSERCDFKNLDEFYQLILTRILPPLLVFIEIIAILPSVLYSAFLIILWLYFRYRTRVKYSGYKMDDPIVVNLLLSVGK